MNGLVVLGERLILPCAYLELLEEDTDDDSVRRAERVEHNLLVALCSHGLDYRRVGTNK